MLLQLRRFKLLLSVTLSALPPAILALLLCAAVHESRAQSAIAPPSLPLTPQSKQILDQLGALSALPIDDWRMHVGDVPNGESVSLNDESWASVKPPTTAPQDAVWYRRTVEIPKQLHGYDLTGARIWFTFEVDANDPPVLIVYFNGRRVAMGEDLEPILLFDNAQPGEKVVVAVKVLRTLDRKRFSVSNARIEFAADRPSPQIFREEVLSAQYLLPAISRSATAQAPLEDAVGQVRLDALARGNQAQFDESVKTAQQRMQALRPALQQADVHLTGNAHIDAAWLWPWSETVDVVRRTFGTALQLMDEYPRYTFSQSAAAYSEWMEQKYPDIHRQIQQRVKDGRWEMVGGMWVEPDLNMPDGESQVRQILIGKRYFQQKFGVDVRIGWNPDSFGYNWQLPQIYKKSGIDYFVTQKMGWSDTNKLPLKLFWWQSPDGSRVLTYFPHDYVNDIDPVKMAKDFATASRLNPGADEMMHLYGIGDHGGGPTRAMLDRGDAWTQSDKVYAKAEYGTAQQFFSRVEQSLDTAAAPTWNYKTVAGGATQLTQPGQGKISLPVWNDELYLEFHRGVFTSQANHKRNMRTSEEQLLNAEKWASLAWLWGGDYPTEKLNAAWKKVLFNQFHDLAAGSGIGVIYQDAQKDYDDVRWTAEETDRHSWDLLAAHIHTAPSDLKGNFAAVLVTNPLAWARRDLVEVEVQLPGAADSAIQVQNNSHLNVPFQIVSSDPRTHRWKLLIEADVPGLGYETLFVAPGRSDGQHSGSDLKVTKATLENKYLRVTVDPKTGCLTSLYDKPESFEALAPAACGNQLQAFVDKPKQYDAWNIDADFEKNQTNLEQVEKIELVDSGPVRATLRITRAWGKSTIVQDVVMYAGLPRVDIVNDIDWHEQHILLKAAFPLAATRDHATYEIPFGSIERPTTRNNSWEAAKFEVPALRWADLGDGKHGFTLINESKYGYDAKGNVLRLSLLRSPTWPDPDADQGHHHFAYSLYPHGGDWRAANSVKHGYEFNYGLHASQVLAHDGEWPQEHSFVEVAADNVILTAMKKTEDGNWLLLRFYESAGRESLARVALPGSPKAAFETDLMEHRAGAIALAGNVANVPLHPYEIKTIEVTLQERQDVPATH